MIFLGFGKNWDWKNTKSNKKYSADSTLKCIHTATLRLMHHINIAIMQAYIEGLIGRNLSCLGNNIALRILGNAKTSRQGLQWA